jgi:osmotically-inducible protein OsmY
MRPIRKTDPDLCDDVSRELAWEPRIADKGIAVQASDGVVMLAGTVESWASRNAAVEAAHRVAGVLDVANELEVIPPGGTEVTDADLAHAVRRALEWDALAPAEHVHVTVARGNITLTGTVQSIAERTEAEHAIERLRGVRHIENRIDVCPAVDPGSLGAQIEAALVRRAAGETWHLQLTIADGRVIIAGTVRSAAERQAVLGTIHGTRGVETVDDRLVVDAER